MSLYEVGIRWGVEGKYYIQAESEEEALQKAWDEENFPDDQNWIDDSIVVGPATKIKD